MADEQGSQPTPSPAGGSATHHVKRVVIALVAVALAALIARQVVYPATYGDVGNYRAAAVPQLMSVYPPLHQGRDKCAECHDDEAEAHAKDVHVTVQCETCHGPGASHVRAQEEGVETPEGEVQIYVPRTQAACLTCHRRLLARPAAFPQIDVKEHYEMLGVVQTDVACSECHSPHEPLYIDRSLADARLHPVISDCASCHKEKRDAATARPTTHPLIFECAYCHGEISEDYGGRTHADYRCGICHQYYPLSERGGRILKHRDPRFCLLCHADRPFKGGDAAPSITWPDHRADVGDTGAGAEAVCADCHRDAFHLSPADLAGTGGQP